MINTEITHKVATNVGDVDKIIIVIIITALLWCLSYVYFFHGFVLQREQSFILVTLDTNGGEDRRCQSHTAIECLIR